MCRSTWSLTATLPFAHNMALASRVLLGSDFGCSCKVQPVRQFRDVTLHCISLAIYLLEPTPHTIRGPRVAPSNENLGLGPRRSLDRVEPTSSHTASKQLRPINMYGIIN